MDTVPVLKKYAERKHAIDGKWFMVTGDIKEIYDLARNSYFADGDYTLQKKGNTFLHSENFVLVDQQGRIRGVYNGTLPAEMERLKENRMTMPTGIKIERRCENFRDVINQNTICIELDIQSLTHRPTLFVPLRGGKTLSYF